MSTYDNRLNRHSGYCVPCSPTSKQVKPAETQKPKPVCCKDFKITAITKVKDKVVVTFDDCTFLEAGLDVLEESLARDIVKELTTKVEAVESKFKKLTDNIVDITGLDGELSHLAINKSYKG